MLAPVEPALPSTKRIGTKRVHCLSVVARLLRFIFVVPLTALTLHRLQPVMPWWSWCGVSALTLLFLWFIDGCIALLRSRRRRNLDPS